MSNFCYKFINYLTNLHFCTKCPHPTFSLSFIQIWYYKSLWDPFHQEVERQVIHFTSAGGQITAWCDIYYDDVIGLMQLARRSKVSTWRWWQVNRKWFNIRLLVDDNFFDVIYWEFLCCGFRVNVTGDKWTLVSSHMMNMNVVVPQLIDWLIDTLIIINL